MKAGASLPGRLLSLLKAAAASAWFGALLVVCAVGLIAFVGRAPAPPSGKERPVGAEAREKPGFHFRDIRFVGRTAGKRDWELEVAKVTAPRDGQQVDFYYVRRGVVYREGQPYLNLTADGGVYYPQQNNFLMRGNVVVSRANGDLLRAEELQWNPLTRQVTSPQAVEAKVEGIWFRANRLVVDVATETMIASGQVELVKDNGERMAGDTIIYSLKDAKWEIQGPVEFTIRLGGDDEPFVAPGLGQRRSGQE